MTANMSDMKKAMMETQSGEKVTSKTNIFLLNTFTLIYFFLEICLFSSFSLPSLWGRATLVSTQIKNPLVSVKGFHDSFQFKIWPGLNGSECAELRILWPFSYLCNHCSSIFDSGWLMMDTQNSCSMIPDIRDDVVPCLFNRQPGVLNTALTASA